jgi:ATP-dependent Lon protease
LRQLIRLYTREAGVRNLEREVANLARKAIKEILTKPKTKAIKISARNLGKYAGIPRYRYGLAEIADVIGVTTGLAWTEVGGDLLSIEAVILPGKGKTMITGKLGDVMQESIQAAVSYIRSQAPRFGIKPSLFEKRDIHIHVPEGATPKDGPSAGVAMCTSIVSALTGIAVHKDVAMTGEITLRGRVLPIGGLKEKLLAAHRGGVKTVIIPLDNEKDLADIPDNVKQGIKIMSVSSVEQVLQIALIRPLSPIEWRDDEQAPLPVSPPAQLSAPSPEALSMTSSDVVH